MTPEWAHWAKQRAAEGSESLERWQEAMASFAVETLAPEALLISVFENAPDPEFLLELQNDLRAESETPEELWSRYVDETPFSLNEWVQALVALTQSLNEQKRQSPLNTRLGYIACCADMASEQPGLHSLPGLVVDMVEQHGFEG